MNVVKYVDIPLEWKPTPKDKNVKYPLLLERIVSGFAKTKAERDKVYMKYIPHVKIDFFAHQEGVLNGRYKMPVSKSIFTVEKGYNVGDIISIVFSGQDIRGLTELPRFEVKKVEKVNFFLDDYIQVTRLNNVNLNYKDWRKLLEDFGFYDENLFFAIYGRDCSGYVLEIEKV